MVMRDQARAEAFARAIEGSPRMLFGGGTSLSGAIDYGVAALERVPHKPNRRVIDISGDGSNTSGRPVRIARDEAVAKGIVINGGPLHTSDAAHEPTLLPSPSSRTITPTQT